jgi:hypothetical protein
MIKNESDLYQPIKNYLEEQGYDVKSEVKGCDIVASKDEDIIIVELKMNLNITLLAQAVERQTYGDAIYLGVKRPKSFRRVKQFRNILTLLKRLEMGLLFVSDSGKVELYLQPGSGVIKKSSRKRKVLIKEFKGRSGDHNVGGVTGKKLVTAYKEEVIHVAVALKKYGELSIKDLKKVGTSYKTSSILQNDFYGWFERVKRGTYKVSDKGVDELQSFNEVVEIYNRKIDEHESGE